MLFPVTSLVNTEDFILLSTQSLTATWTVGGSGKRIEEI